MMKRLAIILAVAAVAAVCLEERIIVKKGSQEKPGSDCSFTVYAEEETPSK